MALLGADVTNEPLASGIAAIRFLAQPDGLRRTHLTLRGPYTENSYNYRKWVGVELGAARIVRPAHFGLDAQQTVFFRCEVDLYDRLAWKRDYADSTPHITVYDGAESWTARAIYGALIEFDWRVEINLSKIILLGKKIDIIKEIPVEFGNLMKIYSSCFDEELSIARIVSMGKLERYDKLIELIRYLSCSVANR